MTRLIELWYVNYTNTYFVYYSTCYCYYFILIIVLTLLSLYLVLLIFVIARLLSGGSTVVYAMCFHTCAEQGHVILSLSLSLTSRSLCVPYFNLHLFWAIGHRIQFIKSIILNISLYSAKQEAVWIN